MKKKTLLIPPRRTPGSTSYSAIANAWAEALNKRTISYYHSRWNKFKAVTWGVQGISVYCTSKAEIDKHILRVVGWRELITDKLTLDRDSNITQPEHKWQASLIPVEQILRQADSLRDYSLHKDAAAAMNEAVVLEQEFGFTPQFRRPSILDVSLLVVLITDNRYHITANDTLPYLSVELCSTDEKTRIPFNNVGDNREGPHLTQYRTLAINDIEARMLGQVIQWYRGLPRFGEVWWRYYLNGYAGPKLAKLADEIIKILNSGECFLPESNCCVTCESTDAPHWTCYAPKSGPSCEPCLKKQIELNRYRNS